MISDVDSTGDGAISFIILYRFKWFYQNYCILKI